MRYELFIFKMALKPALGFIFSEKGCKTVVYSALGIAAIASLGLCSGGVSLLGTGTDTQQPSITRPSDGEPTAALIYGPSGGDKPTPDPTEVTLPQIQQPEVASSSIAESSDSAEFAKISASHHSDHYTKIPVKLKYLCENNEFIRVWYQQQCKAGNGEVILVGDSNGAYYVLGPDGVSPNAHVEFDDMGILSLYDFKTNIFYSR